MYIFRASEVFPKVHLRESKPQLKNPGIKEREGGAHTQKGNGLPALGRSFSYLVSLAGPSDMGPAVSGGGDRGGEGAAPAHVLTLTCVAAIRLQLLSDASDTGQDLCRIPGSGVGAGGERKSTFSLPGPGCHPPKPRPPPHTRFQRNSTRKKARPCALPSGTPADYCSAKPLGSALLGP